MKKIVEFAKHYYYIPLVALFAVLIARALHFSVPGANDALLAAKADEGFFAAIAYGARNFGDGIVGSFVRVSLNVLPVVIWKMLCTAALLFSDAAAALIVCRKLTSDGAPDSEGGRKRRFAAAIAFTTVLFAFIPLAVLRESVLSIAGTVHFVIPGALLLALYLLIDRAADKGRGAWYIALVSIVAALLSWQAALCAVVICAWYVVCAARKGAFRLSYALAAAAPIAVFIAHYELQNVPGFPEVSRLLAIRSFFAALFGESGFFAVLTALSVFVCARTLCRGVIPTLASKERRSAEAVFQLALCVTSALNAVALVLHSALVPDVSVPGTLTVLLNALTLALFVIDLISDLGEKPSGAQAVFALAALVAAAATLPTYTFGKEGFYLPLVLSFVVLGAEFVKARAFRAALTLVSAFCAYFAATLCLTGGKSLIAGALVLVCLILELSPGFKKVPMTEALAVILVMLALRGIGSELAALAA